ncbi:MAG: hypothetical protein QNJ49_03295 [Mastigocoleus sp. MO_167.B18]|nr:hypothetical protein [Mastigocoleus sp. MO_167.B18]
MVTAEELGIELQPGFEIPEDVKKSYETWLGDFKSRLANYLDVYVERQTAAQEKARRQSMGLESVPEIGAPTFTPAVHGVPPFCDSYNPFDIFTLSPIHFGPFPYITPSKIVPAGEITLILTVLWTNPVISVPCGWGFAPTTQLIGKDVRIRLEQVNLSTVTDGPDVEFLFNHSGDPIILFPWFFIAPPTGANPQLMEVNVTVDVNAVLPDPAAYFAAFGTWYYDIDRQPPFLITPDMPPRLEHDVPMRYMVFPR